jgi:hypothetical protein
MENRTDLTTFGHLRKCCYDTVDLFEDASYEKKEAMGERGRSLARRRCIDQRWCADCMLKLTMSDRVVGLINRRGMTHSRFYALI